MDERVAEIVPFVVSLALGALVGVERERSHVETPGAFPGGVRTFPLIALSGCASAWLGARVGLAAFVALLAGFIGLIVATYVVTTLRGGASGTTTALASVLTFLYGVMAFHDRPLLAAALTVATASLLSLRRPLHELTTRIAVADLYAALKLAALTVIILPLLPDRTFGPWPLDALNLFRIWLFVVLVAALGFFGYVGVKVLGPGRGIIAAGLLGGVVSSTAATYALALRGRESPELSRPLALAIALAWATMCARVLVIVAFLNPGLLPLAVPPLVAAMLAGVAGAALGQLGAPRPSSSPSVPYTNPFSALAAVRFGAIFTAILLLARVAQEMFHETGVLATAAISGTVDVDAIILVVAKLAGSEQLSPRVAVLALDLAIASNTVAKGALAALLGGPAIRRALLPTFVGTLAAGGVVLYLTLARG